MSRSSNPFRGANVVHRLPSPFRSRALRGSVGGTDLRAELEAMARIQNRDLTSADSPRVGTDGETAVHAQEVAYRQEMQKLQAKIDLLETRMAHGKGGSALQRPDRVTAKARPKPVRLQRVVPIESPVGVPAGTKKDEMLGQIFSANLQLKQELALHRSGAE